MRPFRDDACGGGETQQVKLYPRQTEREGKGGSLGRSTRDTTRWGGALRKNRCLGTGKHVREPIPQAHVVEWVATPTDTPPPCPIFIGNASPSLSLTHPPNRRVEKQTEASFSRFE